MHGKWVLISVTAVGAGIGIGALSLRHREPSAPLRHSGAAVLPVQNDITLTGKIRPQHVTNVGSTITGNIDAFLVEVGDEVFEGQTLARIGSAGLEGSREAAANALERAQQQVTRAEQVSNNARLEQSRADATAERSRMELDRMQQVYDRQSTLNAHGATPRLVFEKARQDFEAALKEAEIMGKAAHAAADQVRAAMAEVMAARKAVQDKSQELEDAEGAFQAAEIRSPVAGLVVGRKGEIGHPAQEAGDGMFQIATDTFALEIALQPEPAVLKRIHPGQPAMVLVLDLQSNGIPAEVKEIKGTDVIVAFNSNTPAIRPGMQADVRLKLD
jgi:HlyD family secretion protein